MICSIGRKRSCECLLDLDLILRSDNVIEIFIVEEIISSNLRFGTTDKNITLAQLKHLKGLFMLANVQR